MPTTANSITYFVAADGTLRDGQQGSIAQQPRINYGTDYVVTLSFPPYTIAEGDQLQVALNRTRTFFSSASATGDAPVAAVVKHEVTAEEEAAQEVAVVLSTNTRAMIDQVNGIDHPVRGFFGVHVLRGQSFVTLAVADALMMSLESGPDAISPSLPVVDYPTREEAEALMERSENAAERAEEAAAGIVPPLQLDSPPTTSTSGSVGQLAVWHDATTNKDHLYHLCFVSEGDSATLYHWEECVLVSQGNVAGGYPVLDENGKIDYNNLPLANNYHVGAVLISPTFGITMYNNQAAGIYKAPNNIIDAKSNVYQPIVPSTLDYAVRSVLPNVTEIPSATSDYSLVDSSAITNNHSHVYSHAPTTAPTYRLPQVTNTTIAHYIELTVDFTNVQTYSFLDYQGEPIVPLFTPSIVAGDVYTFKMEYSAIKAAWLIYPQKQGAVADDFVMRGEVGAANGVAGLDANAKVPSGQLPIATNSSVGLVKGYVNGNYGINIDASGNVRVTRAEPTTDILPRTGSFKPIVPSNLNAAVTAAITDANHFTLNDAQKATAQSVFGVGGDLTGTGAPTTSTVGKVMDRYLDMATGKTYTCTAIANTGTESEPVWSYTWTDDINANGGTFAKDVHVGNNILLNSYGTLSVGANTYVTGYTGSLAVGSFARALRGSGCTCIGFYAFSTQDSQFVAGKANAQLNGARLTGGGTSNVNRRNIEELSWDGDLLIAGGHQQEITNIPSNTTEYALKEGVQRHVPALASVYRLPEVHARCIIVGGFWCRHEDSYDGAGYYGWVTTFSSYPTSWHERVYYTANRYPSATEKAYMNTALTSGETAITLPPDITHECILTIKFSSTVLTYEFQDNAGNTLVPLPMNGDIEAGSVVTFYCRYESLLSQWVIMPVMVGKEAQA